MFLLGKKFWEIKINFGYATLQEGLQKEISPQFPIISFKTKSELSVFEKKKVFDGGLHVMRGSFCMKRKERYARGISLLLVLTGSRDYPISI